MRRFVPALLNVFLVAAMGIGISSCSRSAPPTVSATSEDHIKVLKKQVAEQEVELARSVAEYAPKNKSRIDDLRSPVVELLRDLPGVMLVEARVTVDQPLHRIVHLRDWHFIPRDLFALEMNEVHGRELSDEEIDWLYKEFLLEVELVQIEQMALLRCLINHHGLKKVFSEGFSSEEVEAYREKIAHLKETAQQVIPAARLQLALSRELIADTSGEQNEKAKGIETQILNILDEHKRRMLEVGAAGRLLIAGELEDVLPLEDAEVMKQANPISPSGEMKLDPIKIEARHDAQVETALKVGPVAVIVLGGAHDLTESVRRIDGGSCEYLRVTTKLYRLLGE